MAAVKSNKPTAKLKAGKKKPLNKWIIVGGVAAVALIGALVVRFSSASTWFSIKRDTGNWTITTDGTTFSSISFKSVPGPTYRVCFRGRTYQGTAQVFFLPSPLNNKTFTVDTVSRVYCTNTWKQPTGTSSIKDPKLKKISGYNVYVTAVSVDVLR